MGMGVPSTLRTGLVVLFAASQPVFANPITPDPGHGRLPASLAGAGNPDSFYWALGDMKNRVETSLAKGNYRLARESAQRWLTTYGQGLEPDTRYALDAQNVRLLCRNLVKLERRYGPEGKALFTGTAPEEMRQWSRRQGVPIVFFKLVPYHTGGAANEAVLPGSLETETFFTQKVRDLNQGFDYVSGGQFSLDFKGLSTLYVKPGDIDPTQSGGDLLTSRVYAHTLPAVYKWAGNAFIVLVDYRESSSDEAAYMGDGIIHVSAQKLQTLIVMHEILHGLGASHHQDTGRAEERGLMTFERGEIIYLGLDEKNRLLLGWPRVSVVKLTPTLQQPVPLVGPLVATPSNTFHFPSL